MDWFAALCSQVAQARATVLVSRQLDGANMRAGAACDRGQVGGTGGGMAAHGCAAPGRGGAKGRHLRGPLAPQIRPTAGAPRQRCSSRSNWTSACTCIPALSGDAACAKVPTACSVCVRCCHFLSCAWATRAHAFSPAPPLPSNPTPQHPTPQQPHSPAHLSQYLPLTAATSGEEAR